MAGRNPNEAVSFSAHYSNAPLLPHSTAPALHTPLLHLTYAVASYIRCGRHDRHRRILDPR
jgi:hypothetical protein